MNNKAILLVDDEENILTSIGWVLEKNNYTVTTAPNGQQALALLRKNDYDLVITDLIMAEVELVVLQQAKIISPNIGVIILTGYGDVRSAVETLKLGADDYLQKPCDVDELLSKARRSFERQDMVARLRDQNKQLKQEISTRQAIERRLQQSQANLEQQVQARTAELTDTVEELQSVLATLMTREKQLREKNRELHDANTTLSVLMKRREKELHDIRQEFATKTIETVLPLLGIAAGRRRGRAQVIVCDEAGRRSLDTGENLGLRSRTRPGGQSRALAGRGLQALHPVVGQAELQDAEEQHEQQASDQGKLDRGRPGFTPHRLSPHEGCPGMVRGRIPGDELRFVASAAGPRLAAGLGDEVGVGPVELVAGRPADGEHDRDDHGGDGRGHDRVLDRSGAFLRASRRHTDLDRHRGPEPSRLLRATPRTYRLAVRGSWPIRRAGSRSSP